MKLTEFIQYKRKIQKLLKEFLDSSKVIEWQEEDPKQIVNNATYSASFKLDEDVYFVTFAEKKTLFGKFARYILLTKDTGRKHSKTIDISGSDLLLVLRTIMSITEHYLEKTTEGKKIKTLVFALPVKYMKRARIINKIVTYSFRNKERLAMTLVGADPKEIGLGGKDFALYYSRQDGEFEGKRFTKKEVDQTDLFLELSGNAGELSNWEDDADIEDAITKTTIQKAPEKEPKPDEAPSRSVDAKPEVKTPGAPTKDQEKEIKQAEKEAKKPKKKKALKPVEQKYLNMVNNDVYIDYHGYNFKFKYGAPKGMYYKFFNMVPNEDPKCVTAECASINTEETGDEGKLKYFFDLKLTKKFLDRLKNVNDTANGGKYPDKFKKDIDKAKKLAAEYKESELDLSEYRVGSQDIYLSDEQKAMLTAYSADVTDEDLEIFKGYNLTREMIGTFHAQSKLSFFDEHIENKDWTAQKFIIKCESITKDIKDYNSKFFQYELALQRGILGSKYSSLSNILKNKNLPSYIESDIREYYDLEEYIAEFKKNNILTMDFKDTDHDWKFLYDFHMSLDYSRARASDRMYSFTTRKTFFDDDAIDKEDAMVNILTVAQQMKEANIQHTLQDILDYMNPGRKAGAEFFEYKIAQKYGITEPPKIRYEKFFETHELEQIAKDIGPTACIVLGLSKYSDNIEVFKVDFISSWTHTGGSNAQAAALKWLNSFPGSYNEGNLFLPDNEFTNREPSENGLQHFKTIYNETQEFLRDKLGKKYKDGKGTIKLYRGISFEKDQAVNYIPGSIESWTKKKSTANMFAKMMSPRNTGTVLEATVPYDGIFATYESLRGYFPPEENLKGKEEWIVLGGALKYADVRIVNKDNEKISFSEWLNEEGDDMAKVVRIVTTDDEDYENLMNNDKLATGVDPYQDLMKAEVDEDGTLKTYPDPDEEE